MDTITCNYCDKIAIFRIMGDFYTGDTVIGFCCFQHTTEATDRDDCHHLEWLSLDKQPE